MIMRNWLATGRSAEALVVRLMVGLIVFLPEGLQKLLFPDILGAGRFAKIGIPWPDTLGPFVGITETVCGALLIVGLATRFASIPLIVVMLVALASTKLPILLGHDVWLFHAPQMARYGVWSMLHEARTDLIMLLGCIYLVIVGGGTWSLDAVLAPIRRRPDKSF